MTKPNTAPLSSAARVNCVRVSCALLSCALMGCSPAPAAPCASDRAASSGGGDEAAPRATEPEEATVMVIRVQVQIREGQSDAFLAHMRQETPQVLALDGCERYAVFADPDEAGRFLLYEEWASAEAFEAYRGSELLAESFRVLGPMMAGPPDSAYFSAHAVGP